MAPRSLQVLLVEDNPGDGRLVQLMADEQADSVNEMVWVEDLCEGLSCLQCHDIDLVLLDLNLPDSRGLWTLEAILAQAPNVPVVVLTGLADEQLAVDAVRHGAQDYLVKGEVDGRLLARAIRYAVERKSIQSQLWQQKEAAEADRQKLQVQAATDELTGLWNRRKFQFFLEREVRRVERYRGKLALAVLDIDRFKFINDTYGHAFGDEVLAAIAKLLRDKTRPSDIVARYGGEEFVILMPRTTVRDALVPAERLRQAIEKYRFQRAEEDFIFVTASFGLAELDLDAEDIMDTLIVRADEAMYRAKESGRNRVVLWDDVQQEAALS
jgi:diguanylate cyclase (GGDEF)-like protein